jgi:pimeloyl-ACP methyl ester carboxylesterase
MLGRLSDLKHDETTLVACGFELHADVWRGGDEAHVLLLHGLGGNAITWHAVAPILARELRARVLALDLPGFGASRSGGRRVDVATFRAIVHDVMRRQAPDGVRWHLAGNSLGGLLALEVACQAPERVQSVILAALALPLAWGRSVYALAALGHYVPMALPWLGRRLVSRHVLRTGLPGVVDDPVRFLFHDPARLDAELRRRLLVVSADRLTWAGEASQALEEATRSLAVLLLRPDAVTHWIREVRCPVSSIYGSHDPLFPEAAWLRLRRLRPDWHHLRLENCGHVPQLEAPVELLEGLREHAARTAVDPARPALLAT